MNPIMPTNSGQREISPDLRQELSELRQKLRTPAAFLLAWKRILTEGDREQLGNNVEDLGHTEDLIEYWMRWRNLSRERAILDLGLKLNLLAEADHRRLLEAFGGKHRPLPGKGKRPIWDREARELRFEGRVIRRLRSLKVARNVVAILDTFEASGWQGQIANPLDTAIAPERLHDAVYSLNKGLAGIAFHVEGDGARISWRRVSRTS